MLKFGSQTKYRKRMVGVVGFFPTRDTAQLGRVVCILLPIPVPKIAELSFSAQILTSVVAVTDGLQVLHVYERRSPLQSKQVWLSATTP
jgi:hypothetical protein